MCEPCLSYHKPSNTISLGYWNWGNFDHVQEVKYLHALKIHEWIPLCVYIVNRVWALPQLSQTIINNTIKIFSGLFDYLFQFVFDHITRFKEIPNVLVWYKPHWNIQHSNSWFQYRPTVPQMLTKIVDCQKTTVIDNLVPAETVYRQWWGVVSPELPTYTFWATILWMCEVLKQKQNCLQFISATIVYRNLIYTC